MKPSTSAREPLRTGELARIAGVSPDTVRYYERRSLLPPARRTAAGYRAFPAEAVARIKVVRGALAAGFSVSELEAILRERDRGGAPCRRVRSLAAEKLVAVESHLRDLERWRRELRRTLARWDRLLRKTGRGKRAGLLDTLASSPPIGRDPLRCARLGSSISRATSGNRRRERGS
ncbi:MAG TPA: MerR family transcriptional regulator [Candidatus Acidoferrales bacterium]|nr:MerR family transcriptional regulator [Candidatus Acidoferrales bacterium]